MSDVVDRITRLINSKPLPENAEQQLEALLGELPELERELVAADWSEALWMARQDASFDPNAARVELDF